MKNTTLIRISGIKKERDRRIVVLLAGSNFDRVDLITSMTSLGPAVLAGAEILCLSSL
jgi:hypothetical protein